MAFESLEKRFDAIFSALRSKAVLSQEDIRAALREVKLALLEADVNLGVVRDFIKRVENKALRQEVFESLTPTQSVIRIVRDELRVTLGGERKALELKSAGSLNVIMLAGLQGAGKTTTAAKLGGVLKSEGRRVLLAACDVRRPAAIEQLKKNAESLSLDVFSEGTSHPAPEVAGDAYKKAADEKYNVLIIDTSGRLHVDGELMKELSDIKALVPVDYTLLTVDAMTGQDAALSAREFNERVGVDGLIVTKLDSDARGGAVLSISAVTGVPVYFVGMGEKLSELEPFYPDRMAGRILGMGDILSLIESAEKSADREKQKKAADNLRKAQFTYDDFLTQIEQISAMGGMGAIVSMLPGMKGVGTEADNDKFMRIKAIILSMTPDERNNPRLMNPSRKRRIASGSGSDIAEVNRLVKQFEEMQKLMKQFSGMRKHSGIGSLFGRNMSRGKFY